MAITLLSKRLLEEGKINLSSIRFNALSTMNDLLIKCGHSEVDNISYFSYLLKDYDTEADVHYYGSRNETYRIYDSGAIVPAVNYSEIESQSIILSENEDRMTIQCGKGLGTIIDKELAPRLYVRFEEGKIVRTDETITIHIDKNGNKTKLHIYRDIESGQEYVFASEKDGKIDDTLTPSVSSISMIEPLQWTVDKRTRLAICSRALFLADLFHCSYEQSKLKEFMESEELLLELGIARVKEKKEVTTPFGKKRDKKLSLAETIKRTLIGGKRIPYIVGHPGVGKTQIAKSINPHCLSFNISTFTPDTFTGKTSIVPGTKKITTIGNETIEESSPGKTALAEPEWHVRLVKMANECYPGRCVLLLDEFDKLSPNMQVFINGIVDTPRTIAGWELPENVDIIVAGNTEEYSDAAFSISGEVASRLTRIEVDADAIDWLKWANQNDIDPIVKAYLHCYPKKIIVDVKRDDGSYDPGLSLTPRSWDQKVSEEMKASRESHTYPYLRHIMDDASRKEFEDFIDLYYKLRIEDILNGDYEDIDLISLTTSEIQIIINCLIATATTEEQITNALKFINFYNLKEYSALFEIMWSKINDDEDSILRLRMAKQEAERSVGYGK